MSGTTGNFKSSAARSSNMQVGDLVELTWKLGEHLGAAMDVGIVIHIRGPNRAGDRPKGYCGDCGVWKLANYSTRRIL